MSTNTNYRLRQRDILNQRATNIPITIIGAGAIGGSLIFNLTKTGFRNIKVYDFDIVDDVNVGCQMYRPEDIGKPKVEALQQICKAFSDIEITAFNEKIRPGHRFTTSIVVAAVDSMQARKMIFEGCKMNPAVKLFIDPRMAAEEAICVVCEPMKLQSVQSYEQTLYSDDETVPLPCTSKATYYTSSLISGYVATVVKSFANGDNIKIPDRLNWDIKAFDFQLQG